MTDLIFEGWVDESEVGKLREGMELVLNIGALEGENFTAELEYISPKGVEDQCTINLEISTAIRLNEDLFLLVGYTYYAYIFFILLYYELFIYHDQFLCYVAYFLFDE